MMVLNTSIVELVLLSLGGITRHMSICLDVSTWQIDGLVWGLESPTRLPPTTAKICESPGSVYG